MAPTVVIEKGIPIPVKKKKKSLSKYAFLGKMKKGDSVQLKVLKGKTPQFYEGFTYFGILNGIHKCQQISKETGKNLKFSTRTLDNTQHTKDIRIWRTQ